ncbi:MAG TPA: Type 1 glutamine amidotransferase-like domain-containing protein, partial [Candidatus Gracilibacteria bacterium]|nr:Type 1 glutamine amidotransferase-like domain-containing protein [Candidatus Gracilibacteria bacterium]
IEELLAHVRKLGGHPFIYPMCAFAAHTGARRSEMMRSRLQDIDLIYISGGNVFDLRLAMNLSGFDKILQSFLPTNKIYAGYSAAVCVLSPTLKGYHIVDEPNLPTYGEHEPIWDGLGIINWMFAPHFQSDHSESADINKEIAYYQEHGMKYKTLKDGEVIMI